MWVTYRSLYPTQTGQTVVRVAHPRPQQQQRRPMVPRLRQTTNAVPKTVVTLYRSGNSVQSPTPSTKLPLHRKILKRLFRRATSIDPKNSQDQVSLWTKLRHVYKRDNILLLSLMFLDVLVNTAMLVLNYTMLVIDFFDDIEWSTAVIKVEAAAASQDSSTEHELYTQYLQSRRSIMEKLTLIIYVLIYASQLLGFYGVVRQIESLVITYVTVTSIQIIVLCFTVALRPYWLTVCLLRMVLFTLALKQCLRLSDRNVNQVWDFNAAEAHAADGKDNKLPNSETECHEQRRRSQTMPSRSEVESRINAVDRRDCLAQSMPGTSNGTRHSENGGDNKRTATKKWSDNNHKRPANRPIDETSVIEVMASISHVLNIPVSSFDADSLDSTS